jgi:HK97 family phage prohead protease
MERRFIQQARANVRLEKREDGKEIITGYASVFYSPGDPGTEYELWPAFGTWPRVVERVMPGAFDGVLGQDVRGLFNHDVNLLLGRSKANTLTFGLDATGLWYRIVPADTTVARDVLEHLRRGDMDGSSFSFAIGDQRWTETKDLEVREILRVDTLYDVGPVTFPAYESTTAGVRSRGDVDEAREAWKHWHVTQSKRQAESLAVRARAAGIEV